MECHVIVLCKVCSQAEPTVVGIRIINLNPVLFLWRNLKCIIYCSLCPLLTKNNSIKLLYNSLKLWNPILH